MIVAQPIAAGIGFDTIAVITAASSTNLRAAGVADFAVRYGSDLGLPERDQLLGDGVPVVLVQHVERPGWNATAADGDQHGQEAVTWATRLEYPAGAHVALDMEGIADSGLPVMAYVRAWAARVKAGGWLVCMYVGYCAGLTVAQLLELEQDGTVDVLWSDYGAREAPAGVGFVMKQHPQGVVGGVEIDQDTCYGHDARGRQLVGMALGDEPVPETDPDPHQDPPDVQRPGPG